MGKRLDLNEARILVRGVNWLGDAIMTTPALLRLKQAYPRARITIASPAKIAALWEHHPAISEVIEIGPGENPLALGKRLRAFKFDLALILPNSLRTALEVRAARIPRRVGYAGNGRSLLLTTAIPRAKRDSAMRKRTVAEIKQLIRSGQTPEPPLAGHHIFHYLRLVEALGVSPEPLKPLVAVSPEERREFSRKHQLPAQGVCGLIPGAEYGSAKRWPWESFAEAVLQVQRQAPQHWLIFGSKGDMKLAEQISGRIRGKFPGMVTDLTGRTTLRELMAGLGHCQAVLTNDTGPMHVAAALNTPVVAIFGSTSPELTAPGLPGSFPGILLQKRPPCAPCFLRECPIDLRCLREIRPEDAAGALLNLIRGT